MSPLTFSKTDVPSVGRPTKPVSEYGDVVKSLAADRDHALTVQLDGDADTAAAIVQTMRTDARKLELPITIRSSIKKDGKKVTLTVWAVDKIKQTRKPKEDVVLPTAAA